MNTTNYTIQTVTLNVTNLNKMSHFYQEIMGLEVLATTTTHISLGLKATQQTLLTLVQVRAPINHTSGLYHVAYLLPSRTALGNFLRHLAISQYPIDGASDHGYSEAVYLSDPEGNGIEVYADKPQALWDYQANGIIAGITDPMDVTSVLALADEEFERMAPGSLIGHVHLAVAAVEPTSHFFQTILGFTITTKFGSQAAFYGKDGYHHQFASNSWASSELPEKQRLTLGLNSLTVGVAPTVLAATVAQLVEHDYPHTLENNSLFFKTPTGIPFTYQLL